MELFHFSSHEKGEQTPPPSSYIIPYIPYTVVIYHSVFSSLALLPSAKLVPIPWSAPSPCSDHGLYPSTFSAWGGRTLYPALATCGAGFQPELQIHIPTAGGLPQGARPFPLCLHARRSRGFQQATDTFIHSNPSKDMGPSEKLQSYSKNRKSCWETSRGGSAPAEEHPPGEVPISAHTAVRRGAGGGVAIITSLMSLLCDLRPGGRLQFLPR